MRRDSSDTRKKILTACVRLFLEQGYKNTSVSQIVDEAGVARGSYLNLFPTKDKILLDLTETMFGGQFYDFRFLHAEWYYHDHAG